jgi:hypothetical protein
MRPGATPKLMKTERLSSSAPNFEVPFNSRARRPSRRPNRGEDDGRESEPVGPERHANGGRQSASSDQAGAAHGNPAGTAAVATPIAEGGLD